LPVTIICPTCILYLFRGRGSAKSFQGQMFIHFSGFLIGFLVFNDPITILNVFSSFFVDCTPSQLGLADGRIPSSSIKVSSEDAIYTKAQLGAGLKF